MRNLVLLLLLFASVLRVDAGNKIVISKQDCQLFVLTSCSDTLYIFPCAVGSNRGDKQKSGDHKTPEGTFTIASIEKASHRTHDFRDGHGPRAGAYGPWFIRLRQKFYSIGIHGTCFPESIGTRSTEGCIRLRNEDLLRVVSTVQVGDPVEIQPD